MKAAKVIVAVAALACSGSAFAFFDAEALVGRRWYEMESKDAAGKTVTHGVQSTEIDLAAHIDPIPLVPVAFGASLGLGTLRKEDLGSEAVSGSTFEASLEVMAWLSMVPVVTPYARLKYPVVGSTSQEFKSSGVKIEATGKLSGPHINAGVKWGPLPLVKVLLEAGMGMQTGETTEVKVGGTKATLTSDDKKAQNTNSKCFLLGVEVGI